MPDEAELHELALELEWEHFQIKRIVEPDPPWNGQLMAVGIVPGRKEVFRRLSSLPLLK